MLQCCGEYGLIPDSLLIRAQTTTTTSEYGFVRKPWVATRTNEEWTSSATSFSSFLTSKDLWTVAIKDEVSTKVIIIYIFHKISVYDFNIIILKVMHLVFYFIFLTREKILSFPIYRRHFSNCKQYIGAAMNTLLSIFDGIGPSIFSRKMEEARPMREEVVGKVVYFPPELVFLIFMLWFIKYFSLFVTFTWRVNNCFPPWRRYK